MKAPIVLEDLATSGGEIFTRNPPRRQKLGGGSLVWRIIGPRAVGGGYAESAQAVEIYRPDSRQPRTVPAAWPGSGSSQRWACAPASDPARRPWWFLPPAQPAQSG